MEQQQKSYTEQRKDTIKIAICIGIVVLVVCCLMFAQVSTMKKESFKCLDNPLFYAEEQMNTGEKQYSCYCEVKRGLEWIKP